MKKALCLYLLGFYQLASVTEAFFLGQKLFSVAEICYMTETYFLWQKCVSLTKNSEEICFCDWNLFPKGNFFSSRICSLKETCFCDIPFFSIKEISFSFFVTINCFSDINLDFGFYAWFPGESFREKWEFVLFGITEITTLWSSAPPPSPGLSSKTYSNF